MKYLQYLLEVIAAITSKSASFRLGPGHLNVSSNNATTPAHLTFAELEVAIELALAGQPASVTSGDLTLSYSVP